MTLTPRGLCVVLCLAASGCFGGPTSDWPPRSNDDDGNEGPPKSPPNMGGAADAGRGPVLSIDGGVAAGRDPCAPVPEADGGAEVDASDAGVGDPDDPGNPFDQLPRRPPNTDAGCR